MYYIERLFLSSRLPPFVPPLTLYPVTVVISFRKWKAFFSERYKQCAYYFYILAACSLPLAKFKALNQLDFGQNLRWKKYSPETMELGNVCRLGMDKWNCYRCPFVGDFSSKLPTESIFSFHWPSVFSLLVCVCYTFIRRVCTLCKHTRRVTLLLQGPSGNDSNVHDQPGDRMLSYVVLAFSLTVAQMIACILSHNGLSHFSCHFFPILFPYWGVSPACLAEASSVGSEAEAELGEQRAASESCCRGAVAWAYCTTFFANFFCISIAKLLRCCCGCTLCWSGKPQKFGSFIICTESRTHFPFRLSS